MPGSVIEVEPITELAGGQVISIEVKAATSYQSAQFKALKALRENLGDRLLAGIVLTTAETGYRFGERLYGLPISALWELAASR